MVRKLFGLVGPGFVTASLVLGPGSVTVASKTGAVHGYDLMWWLAALWVFMCAYTIMSFKIGAAAPQSIMTLVSGRFGRIASVVLGVSVFLICTSFQTGDVIGVSAAMSALFPIPDWTFKLGFPLACIAIYYFAPNMYKVVERLMLFMVILMIVSFFANLIMVKPAPEAVARGFMFKPVAASQLGLMTAMAATNFVIAAAMYQAYLVKEKGWTAANYKIGVRDSIAGITVLFVLVGVITITSAAVLKPRGINVSTAADMAIQLEPLLGSAAKILFALGLFAASFSSLAVNALTGATLLADGMGKDYRMTSPYVKGFASLIMLLGLIMAFVVGGTPVASIILVQKLTLLTVPLLALAIIWIVNDESVMGKLRNRTWLNIVAGLGFVVLLYLFYNLLKSFVG